MNLIESKLTHKIKDVHLKIESQIINEHANVKNISHQGSRLTRLADVVKNIYSCMHQQLIIDYSDDVDRRSMGLYGVQEIMKGENKGIGLNNYVQYSNSINQNSNENK